MKRSGGHPAGIVLVGLVLLCFGLSALLASRFPAGEGSAARRGASRSPGLLVEASRRPGSALGFRNLLADLLWLETVQVAGSRILSPSEYDDLSVLVNAVANFDPRFEIPYIMGGLVLGESPRHAGEALAILARGRSAYPGNWQIPFYIGYTQYFAVGDPVAGGRSMADAARLPGSPAFLAPLATRMLAEGRDPETALSFLVETIRRETDERRRAILERRLREVAAERDIQTLEKAVQAYRAVKGRPPAGLEDLVEAGIVPGLPRDPNGGAYLLEPDGTVRSDRVARMKVFRP